MIFLIAYFVGFFVVLRAAVKAKDENVFLLAMLWPLFLPLFVVGLGVRLRKSKKKP